MLEKVLENRPLMFALCVALAVGAVMSIAAGFLMTYKLVTFAGT